MRVRIGVTRTEDNYELLATECREEEDWLRLEY